MGDYKKTPRPLKNDSLSTFVFGKVQPQAVELEAAVLGALMLDREALGIVESILTAESFYTDAHQHIYRAIVGLAERSQPVDLLTVPEELKRLGTLDAIGGGYYLVELSNRVASAANIEYHARIIAQKHIQRRIINTCGLAMSGAYDDTEDVFNQLESLEKGVFAISHGAFTNQSQAVGQIAFDVLTVADAAMSQKGITGIPGGIKAVDNQTGGWQNTDLVIVAGRPGMGKTAFAIGQAFNAAECGLPTMLFSLEMSSIQITQRIAAQKANLNMQHIRTGKLTDRDFQDLKGAVDGLQDIPFYIDDTAGLTISALRSKARKAVSKHGIRMFVIDYLQLMGAGKSESHSANREQQIGEISRGLKALAKELNVPILAISQLSRAVETRGGSKRPMLSDLRESGNLEQDADAVVFLYRPEYYGITEDENGASVKGTAEVIFAKHRNGAVGTCDPVGFKDTTAEFFNLDEPQYGTRQAHSTTETFKPSAVPPGNRADLDKDTPF